MKLVFDIETVGYNFESLEESQQEFILRYSEKETRQEEREKLKLEAIRYLSLYPLTAKVVSIGMLNTETQNTLVLFEGTEVKEWQSEETGIRYCSHTEEEMLIKFWEYVKKAEAVITFNGRSFDIPFLMLRSAIHKN